MGAVFSFLILVAVRIASRLFFRHRVELVGHVPEDRWKNIRMIAVLNHTSLYEPLLAGFAPYSLLWQFAAHGVLPVAEKTMKRPIGLFFRTLVRHVIVVTRQRDRTWESVLQKADEQAITIILPEGRMKRRDGMDSKGRPMTVRGGIADILKALPSGRLLIVYSGGLHHIQAPGDVLPRPFKHVDARLELIDIPEYCRELGADQGDKLFTAAVIADLTERRDRYCPSPDNPLPPDAARG